MKDTSRPSDLVARTLWQVENDLSAAPGLADLARRIGVSRFHLTRAFGLRFDVPLMAYVRMRRLSEAARLLAAGTSVTEAGLIAGYDSAEGFSRAFRAAFDVPPSAISVCRDLSSLSLQEPFAMPNDTQTAPSARIETIPPFALVGRSAKFTVETRARIPALWSETVAEHYDAMIGGDTFGVCHDFAEDGSFAYMVGWPDRGGVVDGLQRLSVPGGTYAVFDHAGHIGTIGATWEGIFSAWAPDAEWELLEGPEFERYGTGFDPARPGGVAIWIPTKRR